jgi:quercetin dioxygenase-like cupin family protein
LIHCSRHPSPARALGVTVTFEPCARTAWHVHPLGQTLIVTAGCGLIQSWGGPINKIRPGDVIGARRVRSIGTASTAMTHIAILEHFECKTVNWMKKVSDEQYRAASAAE